MKRIIKLTWYVKELEEGKLIDPRYHNRIYKFRTSGYDSEELAIGAIKEAPLHCEWVIIKTACYS